MTNISQCDSDNCLLDGQSDCIAKLVSRLTGQSSVLSISRSVLQVCLIHVSHKQCEPLHHANMIPYADVFIDSVYIVELTRVESASSQRW